MDIDQHKPALFYFLVVDAWIQFGEEIKASDKQAAVLGLSEFEYTFHPRRQQRQ